MHPRAIWDEGRECGSGGSGAGAYLRPLLTVLIALNGSTFLGTAVEPAAAADSEGDAVEESEDNCPDTRNPDQDYSDADGTVTPVVRMTKGMACPDDENHED